MSAEIKRCPNCGSQSCPGCIALFFLAGSGLLLISLVTLYSQGYLRFDYPPGPDGDGYREFPGRAPDPTGPDYDGDPDRVPRKNPDPTAPDYDPNNT